MSDAPIKVLCVDDNYLVAEGIKLKLNLTGGFEWLGQMADADDLLHEVRRLQPDIVLLDIDMPGKDAFTALHELVEADVPARVIIISGHVRSDLVDRAIEGGAWGYISKGDGTDAVVNAIRQVNDGHFIIGPDAVNGSQPKR